MYIPIMIIHGSADESVSVDNAYWIYEAIGSEKQLFIVDGAGPGESLKVSGEEYWNSISEFIYGLEK